MNQVSQMPGLVLSAVMHAVHNYARRSRTGNRCKGRRGWGLRRSGAGICGPEKIRGSMQGEVCLQCRLSLRERTPFRGAKDDMPLLIPIAATEADFDLIEREYRASAVV